MLQTSLVMLDKFCQQMPLEWILNTTHDFVSVFLHLMKETTSSIQVQSVSCLYSLAGRKLESNTWFQLITSLPPAVAAAEQESAKDEGGTNDLVNKLPFHKKLSKMLSQIVSSNIAHITTDKEIMSCTGKKYESLGHFLGLVTDMLQHPSGVIITEQMYMWTQLFRDPQIIKNKLIEPFIPGLLAALLKHLVRIRWSDLENGTHPHSILIDATWDDKEAYDLWISDLRGKSSVLFRFIGSSDPEFASETISRHVCDLISSHGNGEPMDHIDRSTNRLTSSSEAVMKIEGVYLALDNILQGLPSWSLSNEDIAEERAKRTRVRTNVKSSLAQFSSLMVSWNPNDVCLKLRHAYMLQTMVYIWKYDSSTLLKGVDFLFNYLCAKDENTYFSPNGDMLSEEVVALRRRSGLALVSVGKRVPELLVSWLGQLSDRSVHILATEKMLAPNQMHLYEFLSCVANAIDDPFKRASFVSDVLSGSVSTLESDECTSAFSSVEGLMMAIGMYQAGGNLSFVSNLDSVQEVTARFGRMFAAFNQILSVGKRCSAAAKKRGFPMQNSSPLSQSTVSLDSAFILPPDEDMAEALPPLLKMSDTVSKLWKPEYQIRHFLDPCQRFIYAISDDDAYTATKRDIAGGGVFSESGTAGSVVRGINRKQMNLLPRWAGWLNELRNASFQLLGLMSEQRVLYSPEFSLYYPSLVQALLSQENLKSMEHRHVTQLVKQFIEPMLLHCPSPLYHSHVAPIITPTLEHLYRRISSSWAPLLISSGPEAVLAKQTVKALSSQNCVLFARSSTNVTDDWFDAYYARGGLFVGDLDSITSEAMVEKVRLDLTRVLADMLMSSFALKGEWALVLANIYKEEQARKQNEPSLLNSAPNMSLNTSDVRVNADGTERNHNQNDYEIRQLSRIKAMGNFLLQEDEKIAGPIVLFVISGLSYPDGYTCRRCIKLCHRVIETCVPDERFTELLGKRMFEAAIKSIVLEPKWMVGIEWDMIALVRDIYCRLVLGQSFMAAAQGAGQQQPHDTNGRQFIQSKNVSNPLLGGGILCSPSDFPRQVLVSLPGVTVVDIKNLEENLNENRSSKAQKDVLRDLLRVAADNVKIAGFAGEGTQDKEESILHEKIVKALIPNLPEKLVIRSQEIGDNNLSEESSGMPSIFD
eukprot:CAMPEP_0113303620 /NCGR_PEP_ID=MMETSP0010_2-20120614/3961_1 /TAXON_ID=216773 ORGANISM="Corethron hystrix, Strain 308" /NCGR_SAMPLE_ID=MMETSP0010_2 /ASSEMBLY_ACC=CAM_ASM_000155 /LENGTH=1151 /DNA_ID=CAMNT_0000157649 /DNA_START=890 /DNA_END=4346 /DNA_ORIENTATION=- /assembly_acc=CAM_ASM_000155